VNTSHMQQVVCVNEMMTTMFSFHGISCFTIKSKNGCYTLQPILQNEEYPYVNIKSFLHTIFLLTDTFAR